MVGYEYRTDETHESSIRRFEMENRFSEATRGSDAILNLVCRGSNSRKEANFNLGKPSAIPTRRRLRQP